VVAAQAFPGRPAPRTQKGAGGELVPLAPPDPTRPDPTRPDPTRPEGRAGGRAGWRSGRVGGREWEKICKTNFFPLWLLRPEIRRGGRQPNRRSDNNAGAQSGPARFARWGPLSSRPAANGRGAPRRVRGGPLSFYTVCSACAGSTGKPAKRLKLGAAQSAAPKLNW